MRWLVFFLAVLNAAIFGYFRLSQPLPTSTQPGHESIQPEVLHILKPAEVESIPKLAADNGAAPAVIEHVACYEWGNFSEERMQNAQNVLQGLGIQFTVQTLAPQDAVRYWVYIPPRKNLERAQAKVEELRAMGIEDTFVVKDAQWRYAISLGIFKDESLANRLADDLRSRGVTNVAKTVRNQGSSQSVLFLTNVSDSRAAEIEKARPEFPYSELKEAACR